MIIAEVGSVHDGSFGNAKRLIDIAKESKYISDIYVSTDFKCILRKRKL